MWFLGLPAFLTFPLLTWLAVGFFYLIIPEHLNTRIVETRKQFGIYDDDDF
jgi:hypothetical protein